MSGRTNLSYRRRHCEGTKEKKNERITSILLARVNYYIIEMWECQWNHDMRENHEIKSFARSIFPYNRPLSCEKLFSSFRKGELFGYVQCYLRVPGNLREKFEPFPPIFKNIFVSRSDNWRVYEKIRRGKQTDDSNPENANI